MGDQKLRRYCLHFLNLGPRDCWAFRWKNHPYFESNYLQSWNQLKWVALKTIRSLNIDRLTSLTAGNESWIGTQTLLDAYVQRDLFENQTNLGWICWKLVRSISSWQINCVRHGKYLWPWRLLSLASPGSSWRSNLRIHQIKSSWLRFQSEARQWIYCETEIKMGWIELCEWWWRNND